ncbi:hypothetical protein ACTQ49_04610 [Luteococcus sp. Sow4_B9]|uniref:hypothetical protein n=1 Tax=Luteococcus sp. Sow4_B9 TaxID=3438792 RepID=UPI003F9C4D8A
MNQDLTPILEDLAAGRITQAEASRRIDELQAARPAGEALPDDTPGTPGGAASAPSGAADEPSWGSIARNLFDAAQDLAQGVAAGATDLTGGIRTASEHVEAVTPEQPAGNQGVQRVSVRATGRRVRIVGDPTIATLVADGPHVLRRVGSTLEVTCDGELGASRDGFSILRGPLLTHGLGGLKNLGLDDLRAIGLGREVLLRVNPSIPVDVEVTAGSLTTEDVPWLGRVRVTAGGAHLGSVHQVADALVQAGSATVGGPLDRGRSRVRVESGNAVVDLTADANVVVHADAQLGRVAWPGGGAALDEFQAGEGAGRLDVTVVMGAASVRQEGVEEDSGATDPRDVNQEESPAGQQGHGHPSTDSEDER